MSEDAATQRALLSQKLDTLSCDVREGFSNANVRLDKINGTVQGHTLSLQGLETRTANLEKFRDMAIKAVFGGFGTGVGVAVTVGGIVFGIGKAAGWW